MYWTTALPVEVVNTVVITGSVNVLNQSPFPTNVIMITPTPEATITPIDPWSSPGGGGGSVSDPSDTVAIAPSLISGALPISKYGTPGDPAEVASGVYEIRTLSFCLPSQIGQVFQGLTSCYSFPLWNITGLKILGVDLVPFFALLLPTLFITFIIIRLRNK